MLKQYKCASNSADHKQPAYLHIIQQPVLASLSGAQRSFVCKYRAWNPTGAIPSIHRRRIIRQPCSIASDVFDWPHGISDHTPPSHPSHHQVSNRRAEDRQQSALRYSSLGITEIAGDVGPGQNSGCRREEDGKNGKERVPVTETGHKVGTKRFHWNSHAFKTMHYYTSNVYYLHIWLCCKICNNANHQPGIERVQALIDISRSALCCHGIRAVV